MPLIEANDPIFWKKFIASSDDVCGMGPFDAVILLQTVLLDPVMSHCSAVFLYWLHAFSQYRAVELATTPVDSHVTF